LQSVILWLNLWRLQRVVIDVEFIVLSALLAFFREESFMFEQLQVVVDLIDRLVLLVHVLIIMDLRPVEDLTLLELGHNRDLLFLATFRVGVIAHSVIF
jgi:hypothetical protein